MTGPTVRGGRDAAQTLADEQAALRRIATLVARGVPRREVFEAVVAETRRVLGAQATGLMRYWPDGGASILTLNSVDDNALRVGARLTLEGDSVARRVLTTGKAASIDSYEDLSGSLAALQRDLGYDAAAGAPVLAEGRLWGVIVASWDRPPSMLTDLAERLAQFSELIATAIANAETRDAMRAVAQEQAALRRIAMLVAEGSEPAAVFDAVVQEVCRILGADSTRLMRCGADETTATIVASCGASGDELGVGAQLSLDGETLTGAVRQLGRSVRVETAALPDGQLADRLRAMGVRCAVGAPVVVDGQFWGMIGAAWHRDDPAPADIAEHITRFTDMVATALANAAGRDALRALAEEQAALRRVATLVARGVTPTEVFKAVAHETKRVLNVDATALVRYETDGSATVLAQDAMFDSAIGVGARLTLRDDDAVAIVLRTGKPARIDGCEGASGTRPHDVDHRSSAGAPVMVERRLWGAIVVAWGGDRQMPPHGEDKLAQFTELLATAIANTESRAEVAESRARIMLAADDARRRIQRDLHDTAQQRLVSVTFDVRSAQAMTRPDETELAAKLDQIANAVDEAAQELQAISRGLHPAALSRGGLASALKALVRRSVVTVELSIQLPGPLPEPLEVAAYYIVSEAVTNTAKHADASRIDIQVGAEDDQLVLIVRDDGIGGADPSRGSGLMGLHDRVEALGGRLEISSPRGEGTRLTMQLPIARRGPRPPVGEVCQPVPRPPSSRPGSGR